MNNHDKITGFFERVIFYNESNFYTVASFITNSLSLDEMIVVGHIKDLDYDQEYVLYGDFIEHSTYGLQFKVAMVEKMAPSGEDSLVRFLSSPLFPSIGKKSAGLIYDAFGDDLIAMIKANPSILDEVKLSEKQKEALIHGLNNNGQDFEHLVSYFSSFGLSINQIVKIEKEYQEQAIELVSENPYRLLEDIVGIGFKTCEKLAKNMSFDYTSPYRGQALIIDYVLNYMAQTGDTYLSLALLQSHMEKKHSEYNFMECLSQVLMRRTLIMDADNVFHHTQYDSDKTISYVLNTFPNNPLAKTSDDKILEIIAEIEADINIEYDQSQKDAILSFVNSDLSILTGGPGTGKTTIVNAMVLIYKKLYPEINIALTAPTGRAAKRLSDLTDTDAFTIHSLLKWDMDNNSFGQNQDEPLNYDILVIDEFSMVDQWLFAKLLEACGIVKKILIVGDENQLPSVLPGALLRDLILTNSFPVVKLEKIYRQKDGSSVIYLADNIVHNRFDDFEFKDEVRFFDTSEQHVDNIVLQIVENYIANGYTIDDIQLLAPMYRNASGINILNNKVQALLNPPAKDKKEYRYGYHTFREGDKVLQLKNLVDLEVYNGDIGFILEIDDSNPQDIKVLVDFDGNIVEYTGDTMNYLSFAYCISIHKSQGSEYPIVIIPIVKSASYMLRKRLLYTAITRSKKNLLLVGSQSLFMERIQKEDDHERLTTLVSSIRQFEYID